MTRVAAVTTAKIARVIRALSQNGHGVSRVELQPDGRVVITPAGPEENNAAPANDLDAWRASRAVRSS